MGAKRKQEAHIRHVILYNSPSYANHRRFAGEALEGPGLERLLLPRRTSANWSFRSSVGVGALAGPSMCGAEGPPGEPTM